VFVLRFLLTVLLVEALALKVSISSFRSDLISDWALVVLLYFICIRYHQRGIEFDEIVVDLEMLLP